jgi:hypothetical protein
MTRTEASKVIALLVAKYPGRFPEISQRAWATDELLLSFEFEDAMEASQRMSRTKEHPAFNVLIELCRSVRHERAVRANLARPAIPSATSHDERRSEIGRQLCIEIATGQFRGPFDDEYERRLREAGA